MVGGRQALSVVGGEVQDSAAHLDRGVAPAVDLPGYEGQPAQFMFPADDYSWGVDGPNGNFVRFWAQLGPDKVEVRYSHLQRFGALIVGRTGDGILWPHVHLVIWVNGVRVKPEEYPQFKAMLVV